MAFNQKKRFIAGAVCPKCEAMDKLMVYSHEGKDFRECVACGFNEEMHFQQQVRELATRVNQPEEVIKSETQVLQFPPLSDKD